MRLHLFTLSFCLLTKCIEKKEKHQFLDYRGNLLLFFYNLIFTVGLKREAVLKLEGKQEDKIKHFFQNLLKIKNKVVLSLLPHCKGFYNHKQNSKNFLKISKGSFCFSLFLIYISNFQQFKRFLIQQKN